MHSLDVDGPYLLQLTASLNAIRELHVNIFLSLSKSTICTKKISLVTTAFVWTVCWISVFFKIS
jgi:hypothetical protein